MGGPETKSLSPGPSPQDTVIALDALSAYWIASHTTEERELNVTLSSVGRSGLKSHVLQLNNEQGQGLEQELQVSHPSLGCHGTWAYSAGPELPSAPPYGIPSILLDALVERLPG